MDYYALHDLHPVYIEARLYTIVTLCTAVGAI